MSWAALTLFSAASTILSIPSRASLSYLMIERSSGREGRSMKSCSSSSYLICHSSY